MEIGDLIKAASLQCLEAKAIFVLKNSIIDSVLLVDPLLKAVHSGPNGTSNERSQSVGVTAKLTI